MREHKKEKKSGGGGEHILHESKTMFVLWSTTESWWKSYISITIDTVPARMAWCYARYLKKRKDRFYPNLVGILLGRVSPEGWLLEMISHGRGAWEVTHVNSRQSVKPRTACWALCACCVNAHSERGLPSLCWILAEKTYPPTQEGFSLEVQPTVSLTDGRSMGLWARGRERGKEQCTQPSGRCKGSKH